MVRDMRRRWLWTNAAVISLGVWLASAAASLSGESPAQTTNDVVCGLLLALAGALALSPRHDTLGRWAAGGIGVWLQAAPLVFWAKNPASYFNDTLVGALAITLSVLVPMMPGMAHHREMRKPGPTTPPGWSYNPSAWSQRVPLIALALLGWLGSRMLACYQLGYTPTIWEPFFGGGTDRVLTSEISKSWPVSDAGLGAFAYTFEMLMGWMGTPERWRTMPWMVTFFFILVVPLGLVHITLVVLQPVVVGEWCTLCLVVAALMLAMIPLAVDEVVATMQFLRRSRQAGRPFWRTFFIGGTFEDDPVGPKMPHYGASAGALSRSSWRGVTLPWNLVTGAACGVWLMCSPAVFGTTGRAADFAHLLGAVVLTFATIATAEVVRTLRAVSGLAGLAVAATPFFTGQLGTAAGSNEIIVGIAIVALSLRRGSVRERYAGWQPLIR